MVHFHVSQVTFQRQLLVDAGCRAVGEQASKEGPASFWNLLDRFGSIDLQFCFIVELQLDILSQYVKWFWHSRYFELKSTF